MVVLAGTVAAEPVERRRKVVERDCEGRIVAITG